MGEKMAPCSQEFSIVNWKKGRSWKNPFTIENYRICPGPLARSRALSRAGETTPAGATSLIPGHLPEGRRDLKLPQTTT